MKKVTDLQDQDASTQCCEKAQALIDEMQKIWKEEVLQSHRSRVKWLQEGDSNTKFYHQSTVQRRHQNKVLCLKEETGMWEEEEEKIHKLFIEFYTNLFKTEGCHNVEEVR